MDVINELDVEDINIIEKDLEKVNEDCNKKNCSSVYKAIEDIIELIIDEAVTIIAGDIEAVNQFSRGSQNAERNN